MSRASETQRAAKFAALRANLSNRASANPATLSEAYGLPVSEVSSLMRSMGVSNDG